MQVFAIFRLDELPNCGEAAPVPAVTCLSLEQANADTRTLQSAYGRYTYDGSVCGGPGQDCSQDYPGVEIGVDRPDHGSQKCERVYILDPRDP